MIVCCAIAPLSSVIVAINVSVFLSPVCSAFVAAFVSSKAYVHLPVELSIIIFP